LADTNPTTTHTTTDPATKLEPIPTPMKLQMRRVRYQVLPVVIFVIALAATAYLWKDYAGSPHGTGEVAATTVRVAAAHAGRIAAAGDEFPRLYDHVTAGQLLARFEAGALIEQQSQIGDDLSKKQDELAAEQKLLDEATKAGADKAKIETLKQQVATLKGVLEGLRAKFNHLNKQIESANITSPVNGTVTAIHHQPNEFVKQGQEVLTITQDGGSYIVSYVRPGTGIMPKKNTRVTVRGADGRTAAESIVQEVGTRVELIPEHQLVNSKKQEWGIPVRIAMPDAGKLQLRPGELVVLNYWDEDSK